MHEMSLGEGHALKMLGYLLLIVDITVLNLIC